MDQLDLAIYTVQISHKSTYWYYFAIVISALAVLFAVLWSIWFFYLQRIDRQAISQLNALLNRIQQSHGDSNDVDFDLVFYLFKQCMSYRLSNVHLASMTDQELLHLLKQLPGVQLHQMGDILAGYASVRFSGRTIDKNEFSDSLKRLIGLLNTTSATK